MLRCGTEGSVLEKFGPPALHQAVDHALWSAFWDGVLVLWS